MRHASEAAFSDLSAHGAGRRALVLFHLLSAAGLRVFCRTVPADALVAASGGIRFADGAWTADGEALAGEGSEVLLGIHDWVLDGGGLHRGGQGGRIPPRCLPRGGALGPRAHPLERAGR